MIHVRCTRATCAIIKEGLAASSGISGELCKTIFAGKQLTLLVCTAVTTRNYPCKEPQTWKS